MVTSLRICRGSWLVGSLITSHQLDVSHSANQLYPPFLFIQCSLQFFLKVSAWRQTKGICMEIEKICRRFIWGMKEGRGKTHLLNWRTLCRPKVEGGLGLRRMQDMNKAFTMKLAWGILNNNSSLWVEFLKAKYAKKLRPRLQRCKRRAGILLCGRPFAKSGHRFAFGQTTGWMGLAP